MIQTKQPAEKLAFSYEFGGKIGPAGALAEILSVAQLARAGGADLVNGGAEIVGSQVRVLWSGGEDGEIYRTTVTVRDEAGQEHEIDGEIAVIEADWTMPDGGTAYLTIREFVEKFGIDEVVRMTDVEGAGRIDRALLVNALGDVQSIVDAYLAARYAVPMAEAPAIVKTAIADMARARLYPRGAPDGIAEAGKAALKLLERISEGKLPLPALEPPEAAASADPVMVRPGDRQYPDRLKGY